MEIRLPASSPVKTALDRSADLYKMLTWVSLLLAAAIYMVGVFGPLERFSLSVSPIYLLAAASNASGPLREVSGASAHHKPSAARDEVGSAFRDGDRASHRRLAIERMASRRG